MAAPTRYPSGVGNTAPNKVMSMMPMPDPTKLHTYVNDFDVYTAGDWTVTVVEVGTGNSTIAVTDADGGVALVTTAANENDGLWIESQGESFLLVDGKQAWIKARLSVGDAIQSDWIVGLHSTSTTPQAATMRFLFESVDASATVHFNNDNNTTDSDSGTLVTMTDDSFVEFAAHWDGKGNIKLYINDALADTMTGITVPAAEMAVGFGYINGAAGAETASLDYLMVVKER